MNKQSNNGCVLVESVAFLAALLQDQSTKSQLGIIDHILDMAMSPAVDSEDRKKDIRSYLNSVQALVEFCPSTSDVLPFPQGSRKLLKSLLTRYPASSKSTTVSSLPTKTETGAASTKLFTTQTSTVSDPHTIQFLKDMESYEVWASRQEKGRSQ